MAKIPYFPFFASDWLGSRKVLLMTDAQKGIYITLMAHQWSDPTGSIPTDKKILQKMLPGSKWINIEYVMLECFVVEGSHGERARNERLTVEEHKAHGRSEKAMESFKHTKRYKKKESNDNRTIDRTIIPPEPEPYPEEPLKHMGKTPKARFTPPTLEEVKVYCGERKNTVNPEAFTNFYESKGWMIGKNKMKNWKFAVHTWENNRDGGKPNAASFKQQREQEQADQYKRLAG